MNLASLYRATSIPVLAIIAILATQNATAHVATATSAARKHRRIHRHTVSAAGSAVAAAGARRRPIMHSTIRAGVIHTSTAASLTAATARRRYRHHAFYNPWTEPTYADSLIGDNIDGEDLVVRKAAVDALGPYNGTVVVANPQTGRILSIVNQKLAATGAFQPCSTVKMVVSLASLSEGIIDASKQLRISRRFSMDMADALAHSNNVYFARLGQQLGFDRVVKYGKLFGLGEKAEKDH
jgi:penicillin-binding protein 2